MGSRLNNPDRNNCLTIYKNVSMHCKYVYKIENTAYFLCILSVRLKKNRIWQSNQIFPRNRFFISAFVLHNFYCFVSAPKKKPIKNRLRENIAHTFQKAACIWPSFVVMTAKWYQTLSDLEWGARYLLPETWLGFCSDKINNCVSRSATFIQKLGLWVVLIQLSLEPM